MTQLPSFPSSLAVSFHYLVDSEFLGTDDEKVPEGNMVKVRHLREQCLKFLSRFLVQHIRKGFAVT